MQGEETNRKTYYILGVTGTFQEWDRAAPGKLTKPRSFMGYVENTDWGFSVGENLVYAHRFPEPRPLPIDPKDFGPWWYKVEKQHWIEVEETLIVKRTVLHKEPEQ